MAEPWPRTRGGLFLLLAVGAVATDAVLSTLINLAAPGGTYAAGALVVPAAVLVEALAGTVLWLVVRLPKGGTVALQYGLLLATAELVRLLALLAFGAAVHALFLAAVLAGALVAGLSFYFRQAPRELTERRSGGQQAASILATVLTVMLLTASILLMSCYLLLRP